MLGKCFTTKLNLQSNFVFWVWMFEARSYLCSLGCSLDVVISLINLDFGLTVA